MKCYTCKGSKTVYSYSKGNIHCPTCNGTGDIRRPKKGKK